jgi:hypothetical protein
MLSFDQWFLIAYTANTVVAVMALLWVAGDENQDENQEV